MSANWILVPRYFLRLQIHTNVLHKFCHLFLKNFSITTEPVVLLLLMWQGIATAQGIVHVVVTFRVKKVLIQLNINEKFTLKRDIKVHKVSRG